MKNKKGFTLVELIVSFVLITVISISLFKTVLHLQEKQQLNLAKNNFKAFTTILNNSLQKDLLNDKIESVIACGSMCYDITYTKKGKVTLSYDEKTNTISYGNVKEKIPKDYKFLDDIKVTSYIGTGDGFNSYLTVSMSMKSNFEDKINNIKYMYQYDSEENEIIIDLKWNAVKYIENLLANESTLNNGLARTTVTYTDATIGDEVNEFYLQERGITTKYTGCKDTETKECTDDKVIRNNEWIGLVGLMYKSDLKFTGGWIIDNQFWRWTITPEASSYNSFCVIRSQPSGLYSAGTITYDNYVANPTVYLKPDVNIIGGDGNLNPYKLSV